MRKIKSLLAGMLLIPALIQAQVPAADNATGNANITMNWLMTTAFDPAGNTLSQKKMFYDNSGNMLQTQAKVFYRSSPTTVYTHVLATSTIHDAEDRFVLNTLPAPIDYADFNYMPNFVMATDGTNYSFKNFDRFNPSGTETDLTNSPQIVGGQTTKGTLGWYYGTGNTWEPYTPTSSYPYSRKTIYKDGSNNDKKQAGAGEALVMGSNHEASSYITPVTGELNNYVSVRNHCFSSGQMGSLPANLVSNAIQTVGRDANGNEAITISDLGGKVLMIARPGTDMTFTNSFSVAAPGTINYTQQIVCNTGSGYSIQVLEGGNNMNIYLSSGSTATSIYSGSSSSYPINSSIPGTGTLVVQSDVSFYLVYVVNGIQYSIGSGVIGGAVLPTVGYFKILADNTAVSISGSYTLYDMNTEAVTSLNAGQLNRGYYKLIANSGIATASYSEALTDVSYNFYNSIGQLVANVPPNGVKQLEGTGYTSYSTPASIPFVNLFTYDTQGRMVGSASPDQGSVQTVFRTDGKIRFSQNAVQATTGAFSYTNYDPFGRTIESGQYQPDAGGIAFSNAASIADNTTSTGGLTTGTKTDATVSVYDVADNTHGQAGYTQDPVYLGGALSTSKRYSSILNNSPSAANLVTQTWYNYDEEGKVIWAIKYIASLGASGYKTTDNTYDSENRLVKKVFQKNTASETFVHYYQFDPANGNLWTVSTNTVDNPATAVQQAKYIYYLQGGVKRIELSTNLQGIDYTYTLQGSVKAINNSNSAADPGNDATGTNGFVADAFGEVLDYFTNDYMNSRTTGIQPIKGVNTSGITSDDFGGSIKAISWFSNKPSGTGGSNSPITYVYNYDPKYQLIAATWGTGLNFASTPATFTTTNFNQETVTVPNSGTPGTPAYDGNGNILNLQRTGPTGVVTDKLSYTYTTNTDRLASVSNTGTPSGTFSYTYDALGRETSENMAGAIKYIKYDAKGMVSMVANDAAFTQPIAQFIYDDLGKRIEKLTYNSSYQPILATYYYGDAIYTQTITGGVYGALTAQEYPLQGNTGRLGIYFKQSNQYVYELADHLGNIRAVVITGGTIRSAEDYYPFGLPIATLGNSYRYGYQGKHSEADAETGWNIFDHRMYNARIARWFTGDPQGQYNSPYVGMGNNPSSGVDPDGQDWVRYQDDDGNWQTSWDDDVTGALSAKAWGDEAIWLGKENIVPMQNGIYRLNSDQTMTQITTADVAVLGIHSNVDPENNKGLTDGHAWISITDMQGNLLATYSVWPDNHPVFNNPKDPQFYMPDPNNIYSDVRTDVELLNGYAKDPANYNYYHVLSKDGLIALMNDLQTTDTWGYMETCADWSSNTFKDATDVRIARNEWGFIGTPREISHSIVKKGVNTPQTAIPNAKAKKSSSF